MKTKLTVMLTPYAMDMLRARAAQLDRSLSYVVGQAVCHEAKCDINPGDGLYHDTIEALDKKHGMCSAKELVDDLISE